MDFHADKPIYQQIVDYAFARILDGSWQGGERVPSVRDLAAMMSVNSHTALKAYDHLQSHGILVMRRGMGYYLADDARAKVEAERRHEFLTVTAQAFLRQMHLLGLSIEDVLRSGGA